MKWPFVSVVVPSYNSGRTIHKNLEALTNLDYPDYEIIYGDGGSTDDTIPAIKEHQQKFPKLSYITVLGERTRNPSGGRNPAVNEAKGEIIAFTDSDCIPRRDWLKRIVKPMVDDPAIGCVGGELGSLFVKNTFAEIYAEEFAIHNHGFPKGKIKWDMAGFGTVNEAFRKQALDDVLMEDPTGEGISYIDRNGERRNIKRYLYDLSFKTGEDQDVNAKVYRRGWHIYSEPEAWIDHINREKVSQLLREWYWWGDAGPHIFGQHFPKQLRVRLFNRTILKVKFPLNAYVSFGGFHGFFLCLLLSLLLPSLPVKIALWIAALLCFHMFQRKFYRAKFKRNIPLYMLFQFVHCACWLAGWFRGSFRYGKPLCLIGPSFDWKRGCKVEG